MNLALAFTRIFFFILSIFFITTYMVSGPDGYTLDRLLFGLALGSIFGFALIGFDLLFKRFNLRSFNIATLGLFFGYLMGQALVLIFGAILTISAASLCLDVQTREVAQIALFLFGIYLGTLMTLRSADEVYVSIPFIRFTPIAHKKKDLLLDLSVLSDARMVDFAASGLVDNHLVIPQFLIKDLYAQTAVSEEVVRNKAKRSLEIVKKLEEIPQLEVRYNDTDFPEVKDPMNKMIRLARLLDANILTVDLSRLQMGTIEGVRFIHLHSLFTALKPLVPVGEHIKIRIQRYGKEPRQGVGYLEDGTMVVINGGGQYLGETIEVRVVSVKHTSSGRMIFCNVLDEGQFFPNDEGEEEQ